jgi:hypothetical protein
MSRRGIAGSQEPSRLYSNVNSQQQCSVLHILSDAYYLPSFFFIIIFIRIYSLYRVGFTVTILIRLIVYIIYIAPIVSPSHPLPTPLKAIARGFLVLFHIGI